MKTIEFLATLVAMCLVLNLGGCYALTGCPGSAQCDPNWVDETDGSDADVSTSSDGSTTETTVSGSDISSSPETVVVCDPKLKIVAGSKWRNNNAPVPVSAAEATPYAGFPFTKECGIDFVEWFWSPQNAITIHDNDHITACVGEPDTGGTTNTCRELVRDQ